MTKSIFFQRLSATIQFILGFVLGISLITGISATLVFAYYRKMSVLPKKPIFSGVPAQESVKGKDLPESATIEPIESNVAESEIKLEPEPKPEPEPEPEPEPLPPNAYRAEVTWPEGLSLRAEPNVDAERVGGVGFQANLIILEDSADGKWQRIRVPATNKEAWVKGGNTKRIAE